MDRERGCGAPAAGASSSQAAPVVLASAGGQEDRDGRGQSRRPQQKRRDSQTAMGLPAQPKQGPQKAVRLLPWKSRSTLPVQKLSHGPTVEGAPPVSRGGESGSRGRRLVGLGCSCQAQGLGCCSRGRGRAGRVPAPWTLGGVRVQETTWQLLVLTSVCVGTCYCNLLVRLTAEFTSFVLQACVVPWSSAQDNRTLVRLHYSLPGLLHAQSRPPSLWLPGFQPPGFQSLASSCAGRCPEGAVLERGAPTLEAYRLALTPGTSSKDHLHHSQSLASPLCMEKSWVLLVSSVARVAVPSRCCQPF